MKRLLLTRLLCSLLFVCALATQALAQTTVTRDPTSDDNETNTWTGGSAASRYLQVNDHPEADCADAVTSPTTTNSYLTFGYTTAFSIPANATSISVSVDYYDYKNGTQGMSAFGRLKVGGNYYNDATTHNAGNGSGNCTLRTSTWATNPKTSVAWTVQDINGGGANDLQAFGFGCTDCNPTLSVGSVRLSVTYTVTAACTGSTWTSTDVKNINNCSGDNCTVALSGLSTGSLIAVATWWYDGDAAPASITVSDGTNGTYQNSFFLQGASGTGGVALSYFANNQAGSMTITSNPDGTTADISVAAHEFCVASIPASPASGTPGTNSGSSTTADTGTMTPADNDVLLLAAALHFGGDLSENAGGEGFTLSNEHTTPTTGSFVYKIISGAPGTPSHTWSAASGGWWAGIAAFKPTTGAPPAGFRGLTLMGVGS